MAPERPGDDAASIAGTTEAAAHGSASIEAQTCVDLGA